MLQQVLSIRNLSLLKSRKLVFQINDKKAFVTNFQAHIFYSCSSFCTVLFHCAQEVVEKFGSITMADNLQQILQNKHLF